VSGDEAVPPEEVEAGEIEHEELRKLAQSVEPSEVERALGEGEGEETGEAEEGEEEEQVYTFIGKFIDMALRAIAKRRGMTDEDIERYIALNEIEMDSMNEALSPILRKIFAKLDLTPSEIYAVLAFVMIIGPRAFILATYQPPREERREAAEGDQSGSPHQ
jgi:hypothetical protein